MFQVARSLLCSAALCFARFAADAKGPLPAEIHIPGERSFRRV
jgi:hypothetical protein